MGNNMVVQNPAEELGIQLSDPKFDPQHQGKEKKKKNLTEGMYLVLNRKYKFELTV